MSDRGPVIEALRLIAARLEEQPDLDVEVHVFVEYQEPLTKEIVLMQLEHPHRHIEPRAGRSKLVLRAKP